MATPVGNTTYDRLLNAFGGGQFTQKQLQALADEIDFSSAIGPSGGTIGVGDELNGHASRLLGVRDGTASVPVTALGSTQTISRTQSISGAGGNPNSANLNSALSIWVVADENDHWLANGVASYCFSSAISNGTDVPAGTAAAQATTFKAQVNDQSNRRAIGMYAVGVKNGSGTTCDAWGAEISSWNLGTSGVADDPLLLDQPNPGSFGAGRGLVLNSRYGSGYLGGQKPITCALQFQTGDGRASGFSCTASFLGSQMTVSAVTGTPFANNQQVGAPAPNGTHIVSQASGTTGGIGVYNISTTTGSIASGPVSIGATPHDAASGWANCIWISANSQVITGTGFYDNADAAQGTTIVVGGRRKFIIDAVTMDSSSIVAYERYPNAALLPLPALVLGQSFSYISAGAIGGNYGIQALSDSTGRVNTSNVFQATWSADAAAPQIVAYKSRATTIGSNAIVHNGDGIWALKGFADDGSTTECVTGYLQHVVIGTPSAGIIRGQWQFGSTNAGGSQRVTLAVDSDGFRPPPVTFATLTAAAAGLEGTIAAVTDSSTATWGATITGGGSNHVLAYCNGTAWKVMG